MPRDYMPRFALGSGAQHARSFGARQIVRPTSSCACRTRPISKGRSQARDLMDFQSMGTWGAVTARADRAVLRCAPAGFPQARPWSGGEPAALHGRPRRSAWISRSVPSLPEYQSKYVTRLYDQGKQFHESLADLRMYQQTGQIEKAIEYQQEHPTRDPPGQAISTPSACWARSTGRSTTYRCATSRARRSASVSTNSTRCAIASLKPSKNVVERFKNKRNNHHREE
jgi:hypothetical protein